MTGRGIKHGPEKLLNPSAVVRWKQQQCTLFHNIKQVSHLPLDRASPPYRLLLDFTNIPDTFSFSEWLRERKLKTERARNNGTPISTSFQTAMYLNNS